MKTITVTENEAGQRLDKLLAKYLDLAPKSFFYKMMRKKNITLNKKRCEGSERLVCGDEICLFLSEETIEKFSRSPKERTPRAEAKLDILYEDGHILLINKPAGMLSQKAAEDDVSLTEYVTEYLLRSGQLTAQELRTFRPAVCNRLDRNTSGLIVAGKSLAGLQIMSELLKNRGIRKYYQCVVKGRMAGKQRLSGYLVKDERTNRVTVSSDNLPGASPIATEYEPAAVWTEKGAGELSLLKVELITGRTHQIRAHLAWAGHPVAGDEKYGDVRLNEILRQRCGIRRQMLHSWRIEFPQLSEPLSGLSFRTFEAPLPEDFRRLVREEPAHSAGAETSG